MLFKHAALFEQVGQRAFEDAWRELGIVERKVEQRALKDDLVAALDKAQSRQLRQRELLQARLATQ